MTQECQYREPRAQTIFRYTTEAIRNSHHTDASFASALADAYMARVSPAERVVQFHIGTDLASIEKAGHRNAKLVERFRTGVVKLPTDLEEAWIAALPDPWSGACARELAQRYGFLGARTPENGPSQKLLCAARMCTEFGQTIEAIAQVSLDGAIDAADLPRLRRALREAEDLAAEVATVAAALRGAMERVSVVPVSPLRSVEAP